MIKNKFNYVLAWIGMFIAFHLLILTFSMIMPLWFAISLTTAIVFGIMARQVRITQMGGKDGKGI